MVTTLVFHRRLVAIPTEASFNRGSSWKKHLPMLYTTSLLILVRSVFRVIEFIQGNEGYLLQHKWPLYVLDAVLMFLVAVIYFWRYPAGLNEPVRKSCSVPLASFP